MCLGLVAQLLKLKVAQAGLEPSINVQKLIQHCLIMLYLINNEHNDQVGLA